MNTARGTGRPSPAPYSILLTAGCLMVAGLAACSAPAAPADRAGGDTVVLHLASSDGEAVTAYTYDGPFAFIDALEEVSGGRMKVEVTWDFAPGATDAETQLVQAIAAGEVDGGWPATRAFGRAGIEGLEAVEAPMVLASEAAVEELVTGKASDAVLAQLDGTGMTGLSLMAAPLRRPVGGDRPLVALDDWDGSTFRVYNSSVQAATVRALGARPVDLMHGWVDAIRVGDLDGAEVDVVTDVLPTDVEHITSNVVLWPKVFVAAFNEELFTSLSEEQQGWVREAAELATTASVDAAYDATADLQAYCDRGTQVHVAGAGQLDALRAAVEPVVEDLRRDPETAEVMAMVDELATAHPGTDVPLPAAGCDGSGAESGDGLPTSTSPIEDGVYRAEIPTEATDEVGNGAGWSGTWTMTIQDGTYAVTCRPLDAPGTDCGHSNTDVALEAGYIKGDASSVWFVSDDEVLARVSGCTLPSTADDPDACFVQPPYQAVWAQEGDVLTFSASEYYSLTLVPWQRVDQ